MEGGGEGETWSEDEVLEVGLLVVVRRAGPPTGARRSCSGGSGEQGVEGSGSCAPTVAGRGEGVSAANRGGRTEGA